MKEDQEIRARAAQSAATALAATGPGALDLILAADVIAVYIEHGMQAGVDHFHQMMQPVSAVAPVVDITPQPVSEQSDPEPVQEETQAPAERRGEEVGEVIPLAARAPLGDKQLSARKKIEKQRRDIAEGLLKQAKVAKAASHKEKLLEQVIKGGLEDVVFDIDGKPQKLVDYIRSIQES